MVEAFRASVYDGLAYMFRLRVNLAVVALRYNRAMHAWVKVGNAPNESMALMMEGLLREADIPVLIRRPIGFDAPDFLGGGPRELLVPEEAMPEAREILEDTTGVGTPF